MFQAYLPSIYTDRRTQGAQGTQGGSGDQGAQGGRDIKLVVQDCDGELPDLEWEDPVPGPPWTKDSVPGTPWTKESGSWSSNKDQDTLSWTSRESWPHRRGNMSNLSFILI